MTAVFAPMTPAARTALADRRDWLAAEGARLTIDADTHLSDPARMPHALQAKRASTPDYYHGRPMDAEELIIALDIADVDAALCWQNPAATPYPGESRGNFDALWAANCAIAEAAARRPRRWLPAGWTDPGALGVDEAIAMAARCVRELGFPIVKINPAQNGFPMDSPDVLTVTDAILALGATPAFHYGADTPFTPAKALERVAERCGDRPVIAVHMGGGGAGYVEAEALYLRTRELGLRRRNIFFILSARRDTHTESDVIAFAAAGEPAWRRLAAGSDAPYGNISWNFGGWRALLSSLADPRHPDPRVAPLRNRMSEIAAAVLGGNIAKLYADACESALSAGE